MKTSLLFQEKLLLVLIITCSGLFLNSCSKDDLITDKTSQDVAPIKTRASAEFHWRCKCGFLNGGWNNYCTSCKKEYSTPHGKLILNFGDAVKTQIKTITTPSYPKQIELPNRLYLAYPPETWYDSSASVKFYNNLKTLYYHSNPEYAEGVDFAWYRTVRMLYPRITNVTTAESIFDRFLINEGRLLTGANGSGIKDGSKAAIEAFAAYR